MNIECCNFHQYVVLLCRYYVGQTPQILIADVDMLKQILIKDFNNFMDQPVNLISLVCNRLHLMSYFFLKPLPDFLPKGPKSLFLTRGETWKTNRRILSPTFSTSKLKMVASYFLSCTQYALTLRIATYTIDDISDEEKCRNFNRHMWRESGNWQKL